MQWRQRSFPEGFARPLPLQPTQVVAELSQGGRHLMAGIVGDDFAQQLGVAPAIHQDVVAGENQLPGRAGTAYQQQAKQRRRVEREALVALGSGEGLDVGVGVFDDLQRQVDLPLDQLMGTVQAQPVEAAAQDVMAVQRGLPGASERQSIEAADVQAQLVDIGLGLGLVEAVEQHALLHRRQRVEVGNRRSRHGQPVQLALGHTRQREVRRGHLPCRRGTAMLNQRLEFRPIVIRQALDRRRLEHLTAEAPLQGQFAAVHLPFQRQPVGQRRFAVLGLAAAAGGGHEQCRFVELAVELAQVVEGDARRGKARQGFAGVRCAEVTQQAVADAFIGHVTQLFLDRLDPIRQLAIGPQAQREQAGEPTDGTAQVDAVEQLFTAMAFQLDQRRRLAAPAADHPRQCGQQQVVDLGAIGRRGVLQQLAGEFGVQAGFQLGAQAVLQAALRVVTGQVGIDRLRLPVRQLRVEGLGMGLQLSGPHLVGAGLGRQRRGAVGLLQVFKQDAPGHAVHHQVMDHQQQALGAVRHVHQGGAQQRALFKIEAALGFITERGQFGVVGRVGLP